MFLKMKIIFILSWFCCQIRAQETQEDYNLDAFLEAEPIHPTFNTELIEGLVDRHLERQDDIPDLLNVPWIGCNYKKKLKLSNFGTITSPNYPKHYPAMQTCEWTLESEPGTRIEAIMFDMFTQPWFFAFFDYVLISRNGKFTDSERLFGDLNAQTPMTIISDNNKLGIRFRSSTYFNFRGFKLQYLVKPSRRDLNFGEPIHLDGICGQSFLLNGKQFVTSTTTTEPTTTKATTTEETTLVDENVSNSTEGPSRSNSKYFEYIGSTIDGNGKIFGGVPTKPFSYPWMAALLIDGRNFCGGSLIDRQHILTAAHCTDGAKKVSVLLGSHNLKGAKASEPSRFVINVTRSAFYQHPDYNKRTVSHDISIIRLPKPITFTNEIRPICLPNKYFIAETFENSSVRVSGWGKTQDRGGSISSQLQHVGVSIMPNSVCRETFRGIVTGNLLCVKTQQRHSPCKGDSGGPLMIVQKGPMGEFFMQIGIVSFGASSCERAQPVGFTRMTAFVDFVSSVTGRKE